MNFRHAVGFLVIGTVSGLVPRMAPGLFEAVGADGSSGRVLWLQLMSWVQIGLAGGFFLQRVLAAAAMVMEHDSQRATVASEALPETVPAPDASAVVLMRQPTLALRMRSRAVMVVPVVLKAGLLEQRQAA